MKIIIKFVLLLVLVLIAYFVLVDENKITTKENFQSNTNTNTKNVDLSNKNLLKVPADVFDKVETEHLNLSGNSLDGALPSQVGNLKNLKTLDLSNNKFTGVPAEIGRLSNLEILNLSNNQITGLPYELANLSKLKILDLSGNNYSQVDLDKIKQGLPSTTVIKTE